MNYPGICPGERVIFIDPTRTSDPSCVVANEVYNSTHSYAQVDPNGDCP